MLWQIVTFAFDSADPDRRSRFETALAALPDDNAEIRAIRVARSHDDPASTGYITGFDDETAYDSYVAHPAHIPVDDEAKDLCVGIHRLLLTLDDDTTALAPRLARPRPQGAT